MSGDERAARLADELHRAPDVDLHLTPLAAVALVGLVQLALRHPNCPPTTRDAGEGIVDLIRAQTGPEVRRLIADGWLVDPGDDLDADARRDVAGLDVVVDDRMPPDAFALISGDPAHPDRGGDAVVRYVDAFDGQVRAGPADLVKTGGRVAIPSELLGRRDVVRPTGLVWAGIRVDELEPIGYEILEGGPVPLEAGEILGDPMTGRIWVWSRADFDRLADLSRRLHRIRKGRELPGVTFGEAYRQARDLVAADADALEIVRALPAGSDG